MKIFWRRFVNLLAIAAVLFVYQSHAHARTQIVLAQEEQQKALKAQKAYEEAMRGTTDVHQTAEEMESDTVDDENAGIQDTPGLTDGVYPGTGTGFSGDLSVEVTVEDGKISDVFITDAQDDDEYLEKASALLDQIIDAQGTEGIDVVSGATYSSQGILEAVNQALGGES